MSLLRRSDTYWMLAVIVAIPLILLILALLLAIAISDDISNFSEAMASAWDSLNEGDSLDWRVWLAIALVPFAVIVLMIQRASYLKVTDIGMEGYLPRWLGHGFFGLSTGHWKIGWDSVRAIRLLAGKPRGNPAADIAGYRLTIDTGREQIILSPFPWIQTGGPDHRLSVSEMRRAKALNVGGVIERAPLVGILKDRGFEVATVAADAEEAASGFDLAKHPGMVVQLSLLAVFGLYAVLDAFFLGSFMPLEPLPAGPFVGATVAAALIALVSGRGAPARERWAVGMLLVVAVTGAVYPGLLRLNSMTAEPQIVTYQAVGPGQFESAEPGRPDLDLRKLDIAEYWAEYPPGSEYDFELLKGTVGFYQLDLSPLFARTREFYSTRSQDNH